MRLQFPGLSMIISRPLTPDLVVLILYMYILSREGTCYIHVNWYFIVWDSLPNVCRTNGTPYSGHLNPYSGHLNPYSGHLNKQTLPLEELVSSLYYTPQWMGSPMFPVCGAYQTGRVEFLLAGPACHLGQ